MSKYDYFYETRKSKLLASELKQDTEYGYIKTLSKLFTIYLMTDINLIDHREFSGDMILWYKSDKWTKMIDKDLNIDELV